MGKQQQFFIPRKWACLTYWKHNVKLCAIDKIEFSIYYT